MHVIEPFYGWLKYYDSSKDEYSPFHGKEYNYDTYSDTIYGYYIDPGWDFMGSETLYVKILYLDYDQGYAVIEFIGEWNDALNNDIMHLKRNIVDELLAAEITKFILVGENILNFHGSDDSYYEEWFEDVEEGWVTAIGFRDFVLAEMNQFNIDTYINSGGNLEVINWRTMKPQLLCQLIDGLIQKRLGV
ncbi:hypothetical protein SAMN04488028_10992 [Reichenbachiella agariperforans]|uniref:Immunity protein 42 n=1 Tax=Reichenbachiella agariperforans TaxID=156994 RepID=A0A1M6VKQ7_REIAG|nr:hypothetical protein [Reichenbachiella agariperforans]SHK82049.1 hypothetical protein SAMN04488028_10992 [Reichenbachiella agariperforans]